MKKSIFLLIILACVMSAQAYDFKVANADGVELCYKIQKDGVSVAFTYDTPDRPNFWNKDTTYKNITSDTLRIPEKVQYNNKEYTVTTIGERAFHAMNEHVKVAVIPNTIDSMFLGIQRAGSTNFNRTSSSAFYCNNLQAIIIDKTNPHYTSIDGALYTKDTTTLVAYPALCRKDSVILPEGIKVMAGGCMANARYIQYLELPLSLTKMGPLCLEAADSLHHLIIKDNVDTIAVSALDCYGLSHLTLGTGVKVVDDFLYTDSLLHLYCRATTPPEVRGFNESNISRFLERVIELGGILYVPMQSITAYQQALGWSNFQHIRPIEPPVVSGIDNVQVSWVQNFSATGYVWTLYTDEAHTQRYMTLTFDANGHLTGIDLAGNQAPARVPALYEEDEEESTQFAEYYSFTITGLSTGTTYYFTRQSLNGEDIIDEEMGSFETLSSESEGLKDNVQSDKGQCVKMLRDGQFFIECGEKTYSPNGHELK